MLSYLPYIRYLLLALNAIRPIMIIAAYWRPNICKSFYVVHLVFMALMYILPIDEGMMEMQIFLQLVLAFFFLSYSAIVPILL